MPNYELLKAQLLSLKLHRIADSYLQKATESRQKNLDYLDYLADLVSEQLQIKHDAAINYRVRKAKFPAWKPFSQFDFRFNAQIPQKEITALCDLQFLKAHENIILIGPPGVGKTHLAIALGIKACEQQITTLFITANELREQWHQAKLTKQLASLMTKLVRVPLLIIDELGYLPLQAEDATFFFQLISQRYEKHSLILTTNKPFNEWGEVFKDDVIATAILDRLLHHGKVIKIVGESYRIKDKQINKKTEEKS